MKKRLASTIDDSTKLDRKTIERNRRIHMKSLCHQLGSLIPPNLKPPKSKVPIEFSKNTHLFTFFATPLVWTLHPVVLSIGIVKRHFLFQKNNFFLSSFLCKNLKISTHVWSHAIQDSNVKIGTLITHHTFELMGCERGAKIFKITF